MRVNPEYAKIGDKLYKINTDFKVALKCNEVYQSDVSDNEKVLAIIFLLFGEEGLKHQEHWNELLEKAQKFLLCGQDKQQEEEKPDMDFRTR